MSNIEIQTYIGTTQKQHENGLYLMVLNFRKKKKRQYEKIINNSNGFQVVPIYVQCTKLNRFTVLDKK